MPGYLNATNLDTCFLRAGGNVELEGLSALNVARIRRSQRH